MPTTARAAQWPKQYPQENNRPANVFFLLAHSRIGRKSLDSVTAKDIDATAMDSKSIVKPIEPFEWRQPVSALATAPAVRHRPQQISPRAWCRKSFAINHLSPPSVPDYCYHLPGVPLQDPNCRIDHPTVGQGSGAVVTPIHAG